VIGDCYDSMSGFQSGRAFVYRQVANSWNFVSDLRASNAGNDTWFGWCVSVGANNDIAVGAP
jgi:hypothetical protein